MQTTSFLPLETAEGWRARANRELTVVVPAHRCASYLAVAAASVLHGPVARVLISVDGGDTETLDTARRMETAYPKRVRVLNSPTARGAARNVNGAVAHVETPFFAKLDGDDVLLPGFIESAFPIIASRPRLAVVAGHEMRMEADEVMEFRPHLLPKARTIERLRVLAGAEAYRFILQWSPNPCSSGAIYRTEAFREVGGYDEQISWGEDWEIWLRFAKEWEVAYTNTASALYRIHEESITASSTTANRLCYGYDAVYRRAAEICDDPEVLPLIRRAFFGVAKHYFGAASREARRSRKESLTRCRLAWRAISTAMAL
jgi:cellulose synthase/poly-beta-1,6-N-acetylglucosamine synthase-like glycosyltransferase